MAFNDKTFAASYRMTLALSALLALGTGIIGQAVAQDSTSPLPLSVADEAIVDESTLITPTSIGEAQTCLTLEELQAELSTMTATVSGHEAGPLADTSGVVVLDAQGTLAFYALTSYDGPQPDEKLLTFVTSNSNYQTAEGIGPGISIAEAERVYGSASLSYNYETESREFVTFENGPENISFRTGSLDAAGIYEPQEGPYFQTQAYREGATIQSVWVTDRSCLEGF